MSNLLNQVAPDVGELVAQNKLTIVSEHHDAQLFGNIVVELMGQDFDLRVVRDRGDVLLDIKPHGQATWHLLGDAIAYVSQEPSPPDASALGKALSMHLAQLAALMSSDEAMNGFLAFEQGRAAERMRELFQRDR